MILSCPPTQTPVRLRPTPLPGPWVLVIVAVSLATALSGCGDSGAPGEKAVAPVNVLLVSIDTLRADHMSVYGYERSTTPALETLASQGVRFDAAYAPASTTAPSHASLFTSLYPPTHRVVKNGRVLADEHETLAEVLSRWGYQCGAVVSSYVMHKKFNYDQGFDSWNDDFSQADSPVGITVWEGGQVEGKFYGLADDTTRRAVDWLEARDASQPFFLFVHYYDPHDPYAPPAGWAEPFELDLPADSRRGLDLLIASYDGEIAYTDHEIGRLLDALDELGLRDQTLVVAIGDHGEGLMAHGHLNHGLQIYEESVRIPLIFRWPSQLAANQLISTPVSLTDVAPTILELLRAGAESAGAGGREGIELAELLSNAEGAARGRSLVPTLSGEEVARGPVYLYRRPYEGGMIGGIWAEGEKFGLRDGRWKYIRADASPQAEELYDLEADPEERNNLQGSLPEVARGLSERLALWLRSVSREDPALLPLPAEDRARLEALGYAD